jgi:HD-GYP domain-containing protein (c-di-GMP phosphodiesterase class II)
MGQMVADIRVGRGLTVAPIRRPLKNMVASTIRHPDALLWMTKLSSTENYLIGHSVRCSVLAAVFCRHLGIAQDKLERLAFASLLCQIGKSQLPKTLLEKRDALDEEEVQRLRGYVGLSVELLRRCNGVFEDVIEIVENHQERFDGSGYPDGKWGDEIPIPSRIAALVHCYDAMISVRPHTDRVLSNAENLDFLYHQRDRLFQGQLVEEFIQMLGIYPTGTLVELNTGAVALVVAQNTEQRTQPQVLLILDGAKKPFKNIQKVDIRHYNQSHPDRSLTVRRAVNAAEFQIDSMHVMERHSDVGFGLGKWFKRT